MKRPPNEDNTNHVEQSETYSTIRTNSTNSTSSAHTAYVHTSAHRIGVLMSLSLTTFVTLIFGADKTIQIEMPRAQSSFKVYQEENEKTMLVTCIKVRTFTISQAPV